MGYGQITTTTGGGGYNTSKTVLGDTAFTGDTEDLETPPADTNYWPCPQRTTVVLRLGAIMKSFDFNGNKKGTGGEVDGPSISSGDYTVDSGPGKMTLKARCGAVFSSTNVFDVTIEVTTPPGGGQPTAHISGTCLTDTNGAGYPTGKQTLNQTSNVYSTSNANNNPIYTCTVNAVDSAGKPVKLAVSWTGEC